MFEFTGKFIVSMIRDCRKELCLLLISMVLCLCLLLNNGNSAFLFGEVSSEMITDREVLKYSDNRIFFTFPDADRLEEIVEQVSAMPDIYGVYLEGTVGKGIQIQCGTRLPLIDENRLITGKIPSELSDGEVITSYNLLQNHGFADENPSEEITAIEEEETEPVFRREYIAKGEKVRIGNRDFENVAEIGNLDGHIVTAGDFFDSYRESGNGEIILSYVYEDGFTGKQKQEVEEVVAAISKPVRIWEGVAGQRLGFSVFIDMMKYKLFGLIIASLNSFFLYIYLFHKRIPVYTILKLQGLRNRALQGMLLLEYLLIHIAAFFATGIVFGIYSFASRNPLRFAGEIVLYSFGSILAVNLVLFFILTWRLVSWQPFALYQKR